MLKTFSIFYGNPFQHLKFMNDLLYLSSSVVGMCLTENETNEGANRNKNQLRRLG